MTEKHNDGGPAFPRERSYQDRNDEYRKCDQVGMSLRDWFAGQALAGLMSIEHYTEHLTESDIARMAYQQADAMLEARGQ